MTSIHARTIAALGVTQRLLGVCPLERDYYPPIAFKKIMARIRITEELMEDVSTGPFADAARAKFYGLVHDIATRTWVAP